MNPKTVLGFAIAFLIGAACRITDIPVPAPPALLGALLVVSMTTGYALMGHFARNRRSPRNNDPGSGGDSRGTTP